MKKIILIFVTIMLSNQAFASKARLSALGQDDDGSYLVKDNRNIFLNPAQVATLNNSFNFEMGTTGAGTPNAEGGMIYDMGGGRLGMQLGRRSYVVDQLADADAGMGSSLLDPNNTVDVVYGRGQNTPWGVGVHYGSAVSDAANSGYPREEASELQVYGGMIKGNVEFSGTVGVMAKAKEETAASVVN